MVLSTIIFLHSCASSRVTPEEEQVQIVVSGDIAGVCSGAFVAILQGSEIRLQRTDGCKQAPETFLVRVPNRFLAQLTIKSMKKIAREGEIVITLQNNFFVPDKDMHFAWALVGYSSPTKIHIAIELFPATQRSRVVRNIFEHHAIQVATDTVCGDCVKK